MLAAEVVIADLLDAVEQVVALSLARYEGARVAVLVGLVPVHRSCDDHSLYPEVKPSRIECALIAMIGNV